jgi:hypothetical protein
MRGIKTDGEKLVGIDLSNVPIVASGITLLSTCLYYADKEGKIPIDPKLDAPDKRQRVPELTIRSWPHKVVQPLVDKAMEISGLSPSKTEKEKDKDKKEDGDKKENSENPTSETPEGNSQGAMTDTSA